MILTTKTKIESDFINLNKITNKLIQDSEFFNNSKKARAKDIYYTYAATIDYVAYNFTLPELNELYSEILNIINKRFTKYMKLKPICFVPVISDVIETPEQINIRLRKAIENKYK
jgi:hypothetical protein